jgi:hypothetical protein
MEMDKFIRTKNIEHYRKLLADEKDVVQRQTIARLLAAEEAKEQPAASKVA